MLGECIACSGKLLRHIDQQGVYWQCQYCHSRFPSALVNHDYNTHTSTAIALLLEHQTNSSNSDLFDRAKPLLCRYVNRTSHIQIIRITNVPGFYFEQTVAPSKCILFAALIHAKLEINSYRNITMIAEDTIPCGQLSLVEVSRVEPIGSSCKTKRNSQSPAKELGQTTS